jgi:hypothetical protein
MAQFRQCSAMHNWRRRRGSPVLNLRFNFQGELADEGHDLSGYFGDSQYNCYASVPHTTPKISGPPASTVRCWEQCEQPKPQNAKPTPGRRGQPKPGPAPAPPPASASPPPAAKP